MLTFTLPALEEIAGGDLVVAHHRTLRQFAFPRLSRVGRTLGIGDNDALETFRFNPLVWATSVSVKRYPRLPVCLVPYLFPRLLIYETYRVQLGNRPDCPCHVEDSEGSDVSVSCSDADEPPAD